MASEKDLHQQITESLKEKGFLDKMNAEVRTEILRVLKGEKERKKPPTDLSTDNFVINELVKEYLEWNHYNQTSDVMSLETGQPKNRITRAELENTLNIECGENSSKIPLIYSLISKVIRSSALNNH